MPSAFPFSTPFMTVALSWIRISLVLINLPNNLCKIKINYSVVEELSNSKNLTVILNLNFVTTFQNSNEMNFGIRLKINLRIKNNLEIKINPSHKKQLRSSILEQNAIPFQPINQNPPECSFRS